MEDNGIWVLKKKIKLEANTTLSIKCFGNGIVSGRLVAVGVFFYNNISDDFRGINHQISRMLCKIRKVRLIHVLSHSLSVDVMRSDRAGGDRTLLLQGTCRRYVDGGIRSVS